MAFVVGKKYNYNVAKIVVLGRRGMWNVAQVLQRRFTK